MVDPMDQAVRGPSPGAAPALEVGKRGPDTSSVRNAGALLAAGGAGEPRAAVPLPLPAMIYLLVALSLVLGLVTHLGTPLALGAIGFESWATFALLGAAAALGQ